MEAEYPRGEEMRLMYDTSNAEAAAAATTITATTTTTTTTTETTTALAIQTTTPEPFKEAVPDPEELRQVRGDVSATPSPDGLETTRTDRLTQGELSKEEGGR